MKPETLEKNRYQTTNFPLRTHCRVCETSLVPFLDLGKMPLANAFIKPSEAETEYFFPLQCGVCLNCALPQLLFQPDPEQLFHQEYPFFTNSSSRMTEHFRLLASESSTRFLTMKQSPFVIEIGSNDGTLLSYFNGHGIRHLGVEPSKNLAETANHRGICTISRFFNSQTAQDIQASHGKADLILAANTFCHIPTTNDLFTSIKSLLKDDGVLIFEDPYLGDVLELNSYDQIYDEHVFLFSLYSVECIAKRHGLFVFDVERLETHGGSCRYYLSPNRNEITSQCLIDLRNQERSAAMNQIQTYRAFEKRIQKSRHDLCVLLNQLKKQNRQISGYGATSKSTTILNFCDIGPDLISYISDSTPLKQGKLTPGTHIPIESPEYFHSHKPEYAVIFAWNHLKEIEVKEQDFRHAGGKWLVHVPKVHIL